ncbi:MAG TPA: restriction endonuclease subunit S [Xanthobacteraceae bacterium]
MIEGLKPYAAMKNSGVPWLGRVPEHWGVLPNRALFSEIKDSGFPDEQMLSVTIKQGVIRQASLLSNTSKKDSSNEDKSKYKRVLSGDVTYNKMRAWQGAIGASSLRGIVSPAYIVVRLRDRKNASGYFHYLLRTPNFATEAERWSYGISSDQWSLRPEQFRQIYCCVPTPDEQSTIVRFLDHADRLVGRYIGSKRKLIKLLEEQKQAIIYRAVTRGLDPNVRLVPSGVDWLGNVPAHWDVRRAKQVSRILRGKFSHRPRNDPALYDGPHPFIQTGDVARARKNITSFSQTLNERGFAVSKKFPAGTLVMTIAANIGDVAVLDFDACFPDSVVGFVPKRGVSRDFLYFVFYTMKSEFLREAPVNTQGNLNVDRIGSQRVPVPPEAEQAMIVSSIECDTATVSVAVEAQSREIDQMQEYCTRLIADVVTGKLDVRAAAAALPEATDEPDTAEAVEQDIADLEDAEAETEEAA